MDEAFYVLEGSGTFILNDVRHSFDKGASVFIPKNSWHGFENPDHELLLLWIMSPPGLDGFFRETCSVPGAPPKKLTREQIREIALKYDTEFRWWRWGFARIIVEAVRVAESFLDFEYESVRVLSKFEGAF